MLDRLEPVGTHGVGLVPLCWPCEVVGSGSSLAAVICGGDSGVNTADALSEALDLRSNGMRHGNRRDKLVQQQALQAAGLRFARTVSGTTWGQAGGNVVFGPLHDVISINLSCSKSRNSIECWLQPFMFLFAMRDF